MPSFKKQAEDIWICGIFYLADTIVHEKIFFFQRLIFQLHKRGFTCHIKDSSRTNFPQKKESSVGNIISLPPGCTHSYMENHLLKYLSFKSMLDCFRYKNYRMALSLSYRTLAFLDKNNLRTTLFFLANIPFVFFGACSAIRRYTETFTKYQPKLIIVFNRESPIHMLLWKLSKRFDIPILASEGGIIPGTIDFDDTGNDGLSLPATKALSFNSLPINKDQVMKAQTYLDFVKESKMSRKIQAPFSNDDLAALKKKINHRKVLFFAGTNEKGTAIYLKKGKSFKAFSPHFSGNLDALKATVDIAKKNDWFVIYKPHPNEQLLKNSVLDVFESDGHYCHNINIFDAITLSDVCITLTSGVSAISLIYKKPSILLGRTALWDKGATYDLTARDQLEATIVKALHYGFTRDMEQNLIKFTARMIHYYSFSIGEDIEKHLPRGPEELSRLLSSYLTDVKANFTHLSFPHSPTTTQTNV